MKLKKLLLCSTLMLSSSHVLAGAFFGPANPNENPAVITPGTTIERVSLNQDGTQLKDANNNFLASDWSVVSKNGRFVGFTSAGTDATSGDLSISRLYVKDLQSKALTMIHESSQGPIAYSQQIADISNDGTKVLFVAKEALTNGTDDSKPNAYVKNINTLGSSSVTFLKQFGSNEASLFSSALKFSDDDSLIFLADTVKSSNDIRTIFYSAFNASGQLLATEQFSGSSTVSNSILSSHVYIHDITSSKGFLADSIIGHCGTQTNVTSSLCLVNFDGSNSPSLSINPVNSNITLNMPGSGLINIPFTGGGNDLVSGGIVQLTDNDQSLITHSGLLYGFIPANASPQIITQYKQGINSILNQSSTPNPSIDVNEIVQPGNLILGMGLKKSLSGNTFSIESIPFLTPQNRNNKMPELSYINSHSQKFNLSKSGKTLIARIPYTDPNNVHTNLNPGVETDLFIIKNNKIERLPIGYNRSLVTKTYNHVFDDKIIFSAYTNNLVSSDNNSATYNVNDPNVPVSVENAGDIFVKTLPSDKNTLTVIPSATQFNVANGTASLTVDLKLDAVKLRGMDVHCTADANILKLKSASLGSMFPASGFNLSNVVTADNRWEGTSITNAPNPPVSGSGTWATLTYEVQQTSGTASITCVQQNASGENFEPIQIDVVNAGAISVDGGINTPNGKAVRGNITLPNKSAGQFANSTVRLKMDNVVIRAVTDSNGNFSFEKLRDGAIKLAFSAPEPYLISECVNSSINGSDVNITSAKFLQGDIAGGANGDSDGIISGADSSFIGSRFNSVAGDNRYDAKADFNNDNTINYNDMLVVARNFNKQDCQL